MSVRITTSRVTDGSIYLVAKAVNHTGSGQAVKACGAEQQETEAAA